MNKTAYSAILLCLFLLQGCTSRPLQLANDHFINNDFKTAIIHYEEYLLKKPSAVLARRKLGFAYLMNNNPEKAEHQFRNILAVQPDDSLSALYLGLSYLHQGQLEPALNIWDAHQPSMPQTVRAVVDDQSIQIQTLIQQNGSRLEVDEITSSIVDGLEAERFRKLQNLWRIGDCG